MQELVNQSRRPDPEGKKLEYGQSVIDCRGFQVVAFANDILGQ